MKKESRPFGLLCSRWFAHLFWPWEGPNYPSRYRNGPNGPKGPKLKQNKTKQNETSQLNSIQSTTGSKSRNYMTQRIVTQRNEMQLEDTTVCGKSKAVTLLRI